MRRDALFLRYSSFLSSGTRPIIPVFSAHITTLCPKKRPPFYFSNNFVENLPILMIFGVLNSEKI